MSKSTIARTSAERRRRLLAAATRVADELRAAAVTGLGEGASSRPPTRGLLGVEEGQHQRRPGKVAREVARQLEQHRDARGSVVRAHESGHVLGVVVGAGDHEAGLGARDPGDHVSVRALDDRPCEAGIAEAPDDQAHLPAGSDRPGGPRPEPDLRAEVPEGAVDIEVASGEGGRRACAPSPPPQPATRAASDTTTPAQSDARDRAPQPIGPVTPSPGRSVRLADVAAGRDRRRRREQGHGVSEVDERRDPEREEVEAGVVARGTAQLRPQALEAELAVWMGQRGDDRVDDEQERRTRPPRR